MGKPQLCFITDCDPGLISAGAATDSIFKLIGARSFEGLGRGAFAPRPRSPYFRFLLAASPAKNKAASWITSSGESHRWITICALPQSIGKIADAPLLTQIHRFVEHLALRVIDGSRLQIMGGAA